MISLGGLLAWRLWQLPERVASLHEEATLSEDVLLEDAELFNAARDAGLIDDADDGRLLPAPADLALSREAEARAAGRAPVPTDRDLLERLYTTPAGAEVRGQIALWNRTRVVAAVRDNAAALGAHASAPWSARDCFGGGRGVVVGSVPVDFGYVHQGRISGGFGPWHSAAVPDDGCVRFAAVFESERRPDASLSVQFIGRGPGDETYCPPKVKSKSDPECGAGVFRVAPRHWTCAADGCRLEVDRELTAVEHKDAVVGGVKLRKDDNGEVLWKDTATPLGRSTRPLRLTTLDGVELLDERVRATKAARELGLLGLVGVDAADFGALSGRLVYGEVPLTLTLTLDTRLMVPAQEALEAQLERMGLMRDRFADERRAALVVLDAKDGAIRAAATWPPAPVAEGINAWDRAAFSKVYPLRDPFKTSAWQMVDRHNAPGSTFKPVTALAAIGAAAGDHPDAAAISEMLAGLSGKEYRRRTGVSTARHSYNPYQGTGLIGRRGIPSRTVANFGNGTVGAVLGRRERDGNCSPEVPITSSLGLTSATRDSINVWFDVLAMAVDGPAALAFDRDPSQPTPRLWLMDRIEDLGLREPLDLLPGRPVGTSTLRATPGNASLFVDKPWPMAWTLVQNAIGQGAQITPLHLANVAAVIATGRNLRPHLDAAWNGEAFVPRHPELGLDLSLLRAGMKAVPEVGTARGAFASRPERCRFYGKTGTATIGKLHGGNEDYNSAWFMGWLDDEAGEPRYAFACMVTHSPRTGGATCAPVVTGFLARTEALRSAAQ
jgi:cell division protein FtsI/penicillin-binding protein 2